MHEIKSKAVDMLSKNMPRQTAIFEVNQLLTKHFSSSFSADFENPDRRKAFFCDIDKRLGGYPLQYILGEWDFYSLPFLVGEGVLVPRPDTEILVDTIIGLCDQKDVKILDLCSGSGCIAIALDKNIKNAHVTAIEKDDTAFDYLKKNISLNNSSVVPVQSDVFFDSERFSDIDIIVSNPPYIPTADIDHLMTEVHFEPYAALDGGTDGLMFYRAICSLWKKCLTKGGILAVEIGADQKIPVSDIFCQNGFTDIRCINDLSGNNRVILGFAAQ